MAPECVSKYNELKLGKSIKYIIYKLSDDYKEIVVEDTSSDPDWEAFQNKLLNAKAGHKGKEGKGPRYAVYDFQYELEGGEGTRNKIVFISWSPDEGTLVFVSITILTSEGNAADRGQLIAKNDLRFLKGVAEERTPWLGRRSSGQPRRRD